MPAAKTGSRASSRNEVRHVRDVRSEIRAEQENERLNQELRLRLEELQTVFRVAPVGIAVSHDPECRVITGNPAFAALFAIDPLTSVSFNEPEASQLPFKIMRGGKPVPMSELPMQVAARKGVTVRDQELEIVRRDGRVLYAYFSASPLYDDAGRVRGSLGVFVDLTERKGAEADTQRRQVPTDWDHCQLQLAPSGSAWDDGVSGD